MKTGCPSAERGLCRRSTRWLAALTLAACRPTPSEGPWAPVRGSLRTHRFEVELLPWSSGHIFAYAPAEDSNRLVVADALPDGTGASNVFWTPRGRAQGRYVFRLDTRSGRAELLALEAFVDLRLKRFESVRTDLADRYPGLKPTGDQVAKLALERHEGEKRFLATLSFSSLEKRTRYERGGLIPFLSPPAGNVDYFWGVAHVDLFDLDAPGHPMLTLEKRFKGWRGLRTLDGFATWTTEPGQAAVALADDSDPAHPTLWILRAWP